MKTTAKLLGAMLLCAATWAQTQAQEVRMRVVPRGADVRHHLPAVVWLVPVGHTDAPPFLPHGQYTLLQKNRMFQPHVQVVPVGAVVQFPNADPYFHNVFSLFDGKRFDLGLYEAGSSKSVTFSREGVSYIFCNIHPEMSAVILTLSTPYYAQGHGGDVLEIHDVTPGEYELHVWVEGAPANALQALTRRVRITSGAVDLGDVAITANMPAAKHPDKFGHPYEQESRPTY